MKKLTKILLVNWLYFSKQIIEVGDINFLTGKNATGKSTVVDALQIVLLGELSERNFNKAANDKSQRTLDGYLRADMYDKNPKSRRGKDFSSYIACQYLDYQTGSSFVSGIVFDCRNDGTRREQFFIYNGVIPEHCFVIDRHTMDIAALRVYLKSLPDAREEFYDSNKRYRDTLLAKWNVHNEQVCRMLKKAVTFKPIGDIRQFITENICDIPEKPDIESMQQNIRDYKRHEMLAQRQEDKLAYLTEISRLYRDMQSAVDLFQIHKFLVLCSEKAVLEQQIEKLSADKDSCIEGIKQEQKNYDDLSNRETETDQRRTQLIADRANSDIYQEETRLNEQKRNLLQESSNLSEQLSRMSLEIKREIQVLCSLCDDVLTWPRIDEYIHALQDSASKLSQCCQPLASNESGYFSGALAPFEAAQEAVRDFSASLRQSAFQLGEQILRKREELDAQTETMEKLKNNVKDYPKALLTLKAQLETRLSQKYKKQAAVDILADVLEIAEGQESWRGAVEGYLNTQKLYLLVKPEHYSDALAIFDELKREFGNRSFGLVDIGKLREKENLAVWDDSLALKVQTDHPLARSYIDYLLGRVVCCANINQLRKHRTAITADGMLYQGYVARPIPKNLMDDAFIGRRAIELRIIRLQKSIDEMREDLRKWVPVSDKLDKQKNREFMFTKRFIQEVEQKQTEHLRTLEIAREVERIDVKLSQLDLLWLTKLDKEIKRLEDELAALRKSKEQCTSAKDKLENDLHKLEYETLPDTLQQLSEKDSRLSGEFTAHYQETIGQPRYEAEMARLKHPAVIAKNFNETLPRTMNLVENSKNRLFQERNEYVRKFQPCPFRVDALDNDEFDTERKLLSESELPAYREKIKNARESALEQFQNDFLAKLKSSIDQVQDQVKNLNRALDGASFGTDRYRFIVGRDPDYVDYYDMIMAPELMEGEGGLFAQPFQQKYGILIEDLFGRIATSDDVQLNARRQSELQQNIERYTDFRTYLKFDLEATDANGNRQMLSETINTKSGGETQTPFYIAVLASFAQLYRVNDQSKFGNTIRLVVFDEAFNKMDSDRIIESIRLLRKMGLQAIICAPPDKLPDIMPEADKTLLACKEEYTMQILPYSKEIVGTWNEE